MSFTKALSNYFRDKGSEKEKKKLEQLFKNPYEESEHFVNKYLDKIDESYSRFGYNFTLILLSEVFYKIVNNTGDPQIKFNVRKLRDKILLEIVDAVSEIVLAFFKWDLDRRIWKENQFEYRAKYIKSAIKEINQELEG